MMKNAEVARIFREIAAYLEMQDVPFKPRAYEKAAYSIDSLEEPLATIHERGGLKALEKLPGIGRSMAEKVQELLTTGRLAYHEELRRALPADVSALTAIEGIGPKAVRVLYDRLGVRTVVDLEAAARAGRVRKLPGFGEKSEEKILRGLDLLKQRSGRITLGVALPLATEIVERLASQRGVERAVVAGSIRRRRETVGDADFLVVAVDSRPIMEFFCHMPEVVHVHGTGPTKSMVRLDVGIDADIRVVPRESFGAALNYFTGSKHHNVSLRRIAQERKLKLNEYGLFRGERRIAGRTEEELYDALGLPYIPPELREDQGEIEAARGGRLPELVDYGTLRGDLQIQTKWTDGANTIEEMAAEAKRLGLEYIAITDHTRSLAMTGGSDERKLRRQMREIERLNRKLRGITVLTGAEVNINKDGTLDIADEALAALDVVGAAVHSHLNLPRREMTERIQRAMHNPHVDILFHPTGRVLHRREPYEVDMDAIIETARATGTLLEIDALPDRLDLRDEHIRKAVAAGVLLVIDSDAHNTQHLHCLDFGVAQARRGWAEPRHIANTLPVGELLACLKGRRAPARARRRSRQGSKRSRS